MNKSLALLTLLMTIATNLYAAPMDVTPRRMSQGSLYVKVTKITNSKVKFERCNFGLEAQTCERLGRKNAYSMKELEDQRSKENLHIAGAVLADIGVAAAVYYGGGPLLLSALGSGLESGLLAMFGTIGATVGVPIAAMALVDVLNPLEQARQAQTLNTDVITDEKVEVDNIENFIYRLDLVLSQIE